MARTATKAKANEQKDLEFPIVDQTADNHHLVITIAATNSPDHYPAAR